MITALTGSTTEPVIRKSAMMVTRATTVIDQGRCAARLAFWSTKLAATPPTCTG